ncbi:hypothetical protein ACHQM5_015249 [Ranunculus cassubicifolius]
MSRENEEPRFHIIQPLRDPESNWGVDLAKNLEEYLMKICSGEVIGEDDGHLSINFAEAALLLQGSVQVYSRKVEYLYTLVLHALEFLSQKRQQDQTGETSDQAGAAEENHSSGVVHDENEPFLGLDDIPVDAKNCLDDGRNKGHNSSAFVKPPANLVVLEGDCFDSIGDVGELESYLLATNDLYRDFILLDPCDSDSVDKFFEDKGGFGTERGSQGKSNTYKSPYRTPRKVGGSAFKSPLGKTADRNVNKTPEINHDIEVNENIWPENGFPENDDHGFDTNMGYQEPVDDSDEEDDPWKPLNPHETGNLKVKPFKKGKVRRRLKIPTTKIMSLASQFPVAKLDTIINPEYKEIWETKLQDMKRVQDPESPPLYEKLRQSLTIDENEAANYFTNVGEDNEDDNDVPDFGQDDFTIPETTFTDGHLDQEMNNGDAHFGGGNDFEPEDPESNTSLEDLCRSHLDALLASIAETEKQTELAARVSTWKQRIESTLDEQDSHPPFDIHEYGERILDKLSVTGESGTSMSFSDIVQGQEKHDVARTFSALLQLVNNRSVDLDKGESSSAQPVCFTASNPFHVQLLTQCKRPDDAKFKSKKRGKSPLFKISSKTPRTKTFQ